MWSDNNGPGGRPALPPRPFAGGGGRISGLVCGMHGPGARPETWPGPEGRGPPPKFCKPAARALNASHPARARRAVPSSSSLAGRPAATGLFGSATWRRARARPLSVTGAVLADVARLASPITLAEVHFLYWKLGG